MDPYAKRGACDDGPVAPLENKPFLLPGSSGRAALLLHGLGGGPHEVQRLGEALAARGVTARGIQLPGHEPAGRMPASSWSDWYAAARTAFDELRRRSERVDLVGFSTGCMVALHLAAQAQPRGRLVLLAPFVRVFQPALLPVRPEALLRALPFVKAVPRRRPPLANRAVRREVEACASFRTFSLEATRSALALIEVVLAELDAVRAPALILQGRRDTVVDPSGAALLHARLPGSRLAWLERSDHLLALDAEAAHVIALASSFLE